MGVVGGDVDAGGDEGELISSDVDDGESVDVVANDDDEENARGNSGGECKVISGSFSLSNAMMASCEKSQS
jgi:hypothetical protein